MKQYVKPVIEEIILQPEEAIANPTSGCIPKVKGNNGWGNGDQDAPDGSSPNNNAENGPGKNPNSNGKGNNKN